MDCRIPAWGQLGWAVTIRVTVVCVLAAFIVELLATTHLYATAMILVGLCVLAVHDLARLIAQGRRELGRLPHPGASHAHPKSMLAPFDAQSTQQARDQLERERQLQYAEALLDTVSAALFVIREDGSPVLVNRSARRLAGQSVSTLQQIAALGNTTAHLLQTMQPGARHVAYLADGQPVYVSATEFRGAGAGKQRLISLQRIAGELDAIEVKAWQDVAGVLSHEMMNSLTPIASLSENLEQLLRDAQRTQALDPTIIELSGALEAIKRRSQGLMNFVERYRAVAELPEPNFQPVDLEQLFAGIDRLMSTMLREAGIAYHRRIVAPVATTLADAELLEQAVINLIRNASDAVSAVDGPSVTVSCEYRDGELVIAVADNGLGLSEQQREKIFVPFYTTKPHGCGIGLSLTRQIAFAHRGRVEVQSNDPRGSVFSIVLPAAQSVSK